MDVRFCFSLPKGIRKDFSKQYGSSDTAVIGIASTPSTIRVYLPNIISTAEAIKTVSHEAMHLIIYRFSKLRGKRTERILGKMGL